MEIGDFKSAPSWHQTGQTFWNYHIIEVLVFLFLIVPSMVLSFLVQTKLSLLSFTSMASGVIVRDLALVTLVFYFIWRNGESLRQIGWIWKNGWKDLILGVVLFLPFLYGTSILETFLRQIGLSAPAAPPSFLSVQGSGEIILGIILVAIVALAEETIFRGYLLLRFQGAYLRPLIAAVLSSVIFSLGHGYEGTAGVITVGFMGLTFALLYLWRGSLITPITMHFLQDFAALFSRLCLK